MHKLLNQSLAIAALFTLGLAPLTARADCQGYDLSAEQQAALDKSLAIPTGQVPLVQRCDTNGDNVVDILDIRAISLSRNQPAKHPSDPLDWDANGVIDLRDARGCQAVCALPRCATMPPQEELAGGIVEEGECTQVQDFDGDGEQDFVGVYEATNANRVQGYNLDLVILTRSPNGNIQQTRFPYSGVVVEENGQKLIKHNIAVQPPGRINLAPGSLTITEPAVVSYRYGKPATIYYWADGRLNRAFYGIDD